MPSSPASFDSLVQYFHFLCGQRSEQGDCLTLPALPRRDMVLHQASATEGTQWGKGDVSTVGLFAATGLAASQQEQGQAPARPEPVPFTLLAVLQIFRLAGTD